MDKNLSAKYYKENKRRLQKRARERYQVFPKKKRKKSNNMGVNNIKISLEMERKIEYRKKF